MSLDKGQGPPIRCLPLILVSMCVTTLVLVRLGSHQQGTTFIDIMKTMDHPGSYALNKFGKQIPPDDVLRELKKEDLTELLMEYLQSTQIKCDSAIGIVSEDMRYCICQNMITDIPKPCLVYSFGAPSLQRHPVGCKECVCCSEGVVIGRQNKTYMFQKGFYFEEGIANTMGCEVHSFDSGHGFRNTSNPNVKLHSIDIADQAHDNGASAMALGKIQTSLGHDERSLTVLKVVTKPSLELGILQDILKPEMLSDVKFLFLELHSSCSGGLCHKQVSDTNHLTEEMTSEDDTILTHVVILKRLYELGFRIYNIQKQFEDQKDDKGVIYKGVVYSINAVNINTTKLLN